MSLAIDDKKLSGHIRIPFNRSKHSTCLKTFWELVKLGLWPQYHMVKRDSLNDIYFVLFPDESWWLCPPTAIQKIIMTCNYSLKFTFGGWLCDLTIIIHLQLHINNIDSYILLYLCWDDLYLKIANLVLTDCDVTHFHSSQIVPHRGGKYMEPSSILEKRSTCQLTQSDVNIILKGQQQNNIWLYLLN